MELHPETTTQEQYVERTERSTRKSFIGKQPDFLCFESLPRGYLIVRQEVLFVAWNFSVTSLLLISVKNG